MANTSANWLNQSKIQLKECTKKRVYDRMKKMEDTINNKLPSHVTRFVIDESLKQKICQQISNAIDEYEGTKKLKNNQETSLDDVIKNTRTWWNRIKSIKLGSILFKVICFYVLHNFIKQQCQSLSYTQQLTLFIDIFIGFMEDTIKFPRTKPKPLIPHQCFLAHNQFKDICSEFIQTFGDENIEWNCYIKRVGLNIKNGKRIYEYIKEKNRSANLFCGYKQCLQQIKEKISKEFDNELMVKWDKTVHKFRPRTYQLSFRSSEPVNNNNNNNQYNITDNSKCNSEYIEPVVQFNNCNNYNYYNQMQLHPSLGCADHEYVDYESYEQAPIEYPQPFQYYNGFSQLPHQLVQQVSYNQPIYQHRQFQSTNEFCSPLNRIHRRNYGNINENETRSQRREQHVQMLNGNSNRLSEDNVDYKSNDSNTISDMSLSNDSNSYMFSGLSLGMHMNITDQNTNINTNDCTEIYDNDFFANSSVLPNLFEDIEDNYVNHII